MKKALIIATIYPFIDGFEKNNIKVLQELGYEVHTIASGNWETENLNKLKVIKNVIPITRNPISIANIKAYFFIKKYIEKNQIDLIHCHTPVGGVLGRMSNKKRRKRGESKTIYTAHGFHFYKGAPIQNWLLFYPIEKWLSRYTDVLITINKEDHERAEKKFHMNKLEYIPGVGVDIEKFQLKNFDREAYRTSLGLEKDDFMILSVGELNKNKNHEVVIKALAKLNNQKIHYFIAGQGELKEYLEKLSNELGIQNQVHLLGFRKDVPKLLNSSNLYILPSKREGLNVSLMEAMTAGVPCIVSNIRGNVDLINNGINGFYFKKNKHLELSRLIKKSMKELNVLNKNNLNRNIYTYSVSNINKLIKKIYKEI